MKIFISSKSVAEQSVGPDEKAMSFVINLRVDGSPILSMPVDKKDFDSYEVGKYYDITPSS